MEIVFRSSFLLALTCSKRICFPPDTDSFLCVKEWGWSIWGPVPGGAGSPRIREAGALGGGTPPPVRAAAGPLAPAAPKPAPLPPYTDRPSFCSVPCLKRGASLSCGIPGQKEKGLYTPLAEQICFAATFRAALSPDRSGKPAVGPADPLCGS